MRIWFDGQCLQTHSHNRGIGRYIKELICALHDQTPDLEIQVSLNVSLGSPATAIDVFASRARIEVLLWQSATVVGEFFSTGDARRALSDLSLAHHVACLNPDLAVSASLMEGTSNACVPFKKLKDFRIPSAVVFYDAIPYRFRDVYISRKGLTEFYDRRRRQLGQFDLALCISDSTVADVGWLCPTLPATNISSGALHAASAPVSHLLTPAGEDHRGKAPYVFYVGGLDWHKNVELIVDAFRLLPEEVRARHALRLAGPHLECQTAELKLRWQRNGLDPGKLVFDGFLSDADLTERYRSAALVVQPSRHEGFGLTAAEAMLAGAPVAGSRAGALPEVIGREDLLFDPGDARQLARLMERALTDEAFRAGAIAHGITHVRQFTWERVAARAFGALKQLAGQGRGGYPSIGAARAWTLSLARDLQTPVSLSAEALARSEPGMRDRGQ